MNPHLTAVSRKTLPVPVRWLLHQKKLYGKVLDYGCGKCGDLNKKFILSLPGIKLVHSWDPFYQPFELQIQKGFYDVILCTYVLCVLPKSEEKEIFLNIQFLLKESGTAYVSVRNDKPRQGWGITRRGTFQRKVELNFLPLLKKTSQYRIYLLTKQSEIPTI